jgi:hypothetical protein
MVLGVTPYVNEVNCILHAEGDALDTFGNQMVATAKY